MQYIYLHAAVSFLNQLDASLPSLMKLLASSTNSDVEEAIDFFVIAASFKVPKIFKALEIILHLIWSKEATTRQKYGRDYFL